MAQQAVIASSQAKLAAAEQERTELDASLESAKEAIDAKKADAERDHRKQARMPALAVHDSTLLCT